MGALFFFFFLVVSSAVFLCAFSVALGRLKLHFYCESKITFGAVKPDN